MNVRIFLISIVLFFCHYGLTQVFPDRDYPELFHDVQVNKVFRDSKMFPDCIPLIQASQVDSLYQEEKTLPGFNLTDFVNTYFLMPKSSFRFYSDSTVPIEEHIDYLWDILSRKPETAQGSLIGLPNKYIVPGGRFREVYYWDSYFTMLGLKEAGKYELIEDMTNNFAFLIDSFGFIPNGNRTYYLSRSQPPYFSLMVELLADIKGENILLKYLPQLEKEYNFWMDGKDRLTKDKNTFRRLVMLSDGALLNRYWDDNPSPRAEAYNEDIKIAQLSPEPDSVDYRNIRAACESGWDFSSRWLNDSRSLETIETTKILPVDLNCLIYNLESLLQKAYELKNDRSNSKKYKKLAKKRKKAIQEYFWRKKTGYYVDYQWVLKWQKMPTHIAGIYPLYFNIASKKQAGLVAEVIKERFLKDGGLTTTYYNSGHQWDAPNGWAPLEYVAIEGLQNYNFQELADTITVRWLNLNTKVYNKTGKMVEKYNVENTYVPGGGGEYPNQDGFGWTNGVYLYLLHKKE